MLGLDKMQLLQFESLLNYKDIAHFSTTRTGGFSKNHLAGFNLGYTVGDEPKIVSQNLKLLAGVLAIEKEQMVFPKQTHSANIGIVKNSSDTFLNTDALLTNIPGICIAIRTADCVPVLLFDPVQKVVAAIHSGWKGTIQKIAQRTIKLMQQKFGTNPQNIIAGIGPSIGPDVYEIGAEVVEKFTAEFDQNQIIKPIQDSGKAFLNLWEANKQILIRADVPESQIEIAEMCTYSHPELFYSARRDGVKCGRLASGIMIV